METVFHYSEVLNPYGIGTSSGMNFQPTSPALNNNQQSQQFPTESQKQSPMSNKEDPFFYYQESYVQESVKTCQKSVIGKFLTTKIIPFQHINNSLLGIWGNPAGLKITELEDKCYQIAMDKEQDIHRILKGSSWIVRNVWLVVHSWERKVNIKDLNFS